MRLALAACLALGIHTALFWVEVTGSSPDLIVPRSRAVSIELVTFQKSVEKPTPPKPRVIQPKPGLAPQKSKPAPRPAPKPVAKNIATPQPETIAVPVPSAPPPEVFDAVDLPTPDEAPTDATPVAEPEMAAPTDDRAAVQASVPLYDINPPPHYPRTARKRNYQGTVMLDVRVRVDGSVAEVRIGQSSGYAVLDRSAVKSVKGWRFSPALRGGQPIEMWVQVPVRFELR